MEGQLRFPLTIRLPDQIRSSPEEISNILVASVGFVPMAISSGAGAEVQRPLATVVIGGVMTSTLFTVIVLPVCYSLFGGWFQKQQKEENTQKTQPINLIELSPANA